MINSGKLSVCTQLYNLTIEDFEILFGIKALGPCWLCTGESSH